ncbi:MAG: helix-turn-helix domain-containing protein [Rubritepida sp.]|nr:helix-turn-helix domain-containing protein [Rubritepida sp.]
MSFSMKRFTRTEATQSVDTARLGDELRDAREASGLSIDDMSAALRIRRVYLVALEEGRVRDLPSPAYALGFVRNYANALGLDASDLVRRFREHAGTGVQRKQDLVFPEPVTDRGMPAGIVILFGIGIAIAAYAGWYNWTRSSDRSVDAVPAVPSRLERAAREGTPVDPPVSQGPAGPPSSVPMPTPVPVPIVIPPPPPPPPPPLSPNDTSRVAFRFKGDSYIQVRMPNQQAIVARVFRNGETYTPPNQWGLVISVGVVNNVDVLVDGQTQPGFTPGQGIRRDVPIDPALFRAGPVPVGARAVTPAPVAPPAARPATPGSAPASAPGAVSGAPPAAGRPATPGVPGAAVPGATPGAAPVVNSARPAGLPAAPQMPAPTPSAAPAAGTAPGGATPRPTIPPGPSQPGTPPVAAPRPATGPGNVQPSSNLPTAPRGNPVP